MASKRSIRCRVKPSTVSQGTTVFCVISTFSVLVFLLMRSISKQGCREEAMLKNTTTWNHRLPNEAHLTTCPKTSTIFDGECVSANERGHVRYDPCNPRGMRVVRTPWRNYNGRPNVYSPTFGFLERHRFDCIVFPNLIKSILKQKISQIGDVDYQSTSQNQVFYNRGPYLNPIRVLVFGPRGELGKMRHVVESVHRAGKYPLDYIQADVSDIICERYNSIKVDAMNIPFPNNFFTILVAQHVLEHVPDLNQTLNEIQRVLAPGGFAVISAPLSVHMNKTKEDPLCLTEKCRLEKFNQIDHVRNMGADVLHNLKERFDSVRFGNYWEYYEKNMPELKNLFENPEYHERKQSHYIYVFKAMNEEDIQTVFG